MPILEYIWLDKESNFRSKVKIINELGFYIESITDIPKWNYDGSSTGQTTGENTEVILNPVFYCENPLSNSKLKNLLVLCETYDVEGKPLENNYRVEADKIFRKNSSLEPWYGFEQEFFIFGKDSEKLLDKYKTQGQYYCSVGSNNTLGSHREFMNEFINCCVKAKLGISGINAEVAPCQWEYQIGPVEGIRGCDKLLMSRYILVKLAEKYEFVIDFSPKPIEGDINGSGCHTNFSTNKMREVNGLDSILSCIKNLEKTKDKVLELYGKDNDKRMSGKHETSKLDEFSHGIGTRHTSVRIGHDVYNEKKGYFEDRRPASNMNPYLVASYLLENC